MAGRVGWLAKCIHEGSFPALSPCDGDRTELHLEIGGQRELAQQHARGYPRVKLLRRLGHRDWAGHQHGYNCLKSDKMYLSTSVSGSLGTPGLPGRL